jgi:hypothetical protein
LQRWTPRSGDGFLRSAPGRRIGYFAAAAIIAAWFGVSSNSLSNGPVARGDQRGRFCFAPGEVLDFTKVDNRGSEDDTQPEINQDLVLILVRQRSPRVESGETGPRLRCATDCDPIVPWRTLSEKGSGPWLMIAAQQPTLISLTSILPATIGRTFASSI